MNNTFGTPSEDKEKIISAAENESSDTIREERLPRANSNASAQELNQSYTEQLERRISDLNVTVALKQKELEEKEKLEKEQERE